MEKKLILITGASGCVGQYTSEWLLKNTDADLLLLLREPYKLTAIDANNPRIKLLIGDLRQVEQFAEELKKVTNVIHTATAWGDPDRAKEVNIIAVKKLLGLLNPEKIERIIYFSTASILNKYLQPLEEAINLGTEYIQTKALCLDQLKEHPLKEKIVAVFPTLVFGGGFNNTDLFPKSYLTQGIKDACKWLWLARWFKGYSRFHFIHAADIAFICGKLTTERNSTKIKTQSNEIRKYVLGQPAISIDQAIETLLKWRGMRKTPSLPLWQWLIDFLLKVLPIQLSKWDRVVIKQRHFVHEPVTSPEDFGGTSYAKTLKEILLYSGISREKSDQKGYYKSR